MESLPLHHSTLHKWHAIINTSHTLLHSIASMALIYYRLSSFPNHHLLPVLPWLLIFASELILFFLWLLNQAYSWRPVSRTVFPDRLPDDDELPAIDVFICTADAKKEPPVKVMNTVLSAMALDYPPEKLSVYLSDDGGSSVTLYAIRQAWVFAGSWLPFCRRYGIKTRCPEAYFSSPDDDGDAADVEREEIKRKYEQFTELLRNAGQKGGLENTSAKIGQINPPIIEIICDNNINPLDSGKAEMPLLVYVSREKKPAYPHHFKAGALNVLLRVSGMISNSPYILVLDCDMYSNDPASARQAMCFHLDQKISSSLAFVQFPQKFHNISKNDIYDSGIRYAFLMKWPGLDGLKGPMMSGTCFYIKRKALCGSDLQKDLLQLKQSFSPSNEFIKSLSKNKSKHNVTDNQDILNTLQEETKFLASCTYENHTQWGQQIGFLYKSVLEDYFTGFILHCKGWTSVYCNPSRPAFLGSGTINLNDTLVQGTRWNIGLLEVCFSRFCPVVYGPPRMSIPQSMCYGYLAFQPFYCLPAWVLATIPQLCLLNRIPIYPKVSSPWFIIFSFIFFSSLLKYLWAVLLTGGTIRAMWNEWRIWMMKAVTTYFYAVLKWVGMRESSFTPTNKVDDDEQLRRYQMGVFDFHASTMLLAPLVSLVILNMACFIGGVASVIVWGGWKEMFGQIFLSFFVFSVNYPIIEGMMLRKDKGRILPSVTILSVVISTTFLSLGSIVLVYVR